MALAGAKFEVWRGFVPPPFTCSQHFIEKFRRGLILNTPVNS
jgi:hypothetical protein